MTAFSRLRHETQLIAGCMPNNYQPTLLYSMRALRLPKASLVQ
jgi:hypothetical protein